MRRLVLALAAIAAPAHAEDPVGRQIAASAAAAQALQGPLDGTWTLEDRRGRALLTLQIGDPPTRRALACAWADATGARGYADCERKGRRLEVRLATGDRVRLQFTDTRVCRGVRIRGGRAQAVILRRS